MARKLSAKQIAVLKNYPSYSDIEDLPMDVQEELENLNDYETLRQDANRFLYDQWTRNTIVGGDQIKLKFLLDRILARGSLTIK